MISARLFYGTKEPTHPPKERIYEKEKIVAVTYSCGSSSTLISALTTELRFNMFLLTGIL